MVNRLVLNHLNRLCKILKPENIEDDIAVLSTYQKDHSFVNGKLPDLVVYPESREQIIDIIKLASENKIPLVPVSSGAPRFRGDTVPVEGGIIVNFSKMKKILRIDPVNRYVMIEPGVTYGELIPELRKYGLRICNPFLPRFSKSVIASRLEREPVVIPKYQYDYLDPLLTIEVIYGNGDDFRTGSASGPGSLVTLKADKVNPWGPGAIDFFRLVSGAQGTMGFVTWAVIKTEVLPKLQKLYFIPVENCEELIAPIDAMLRKRVPDECVILNSVNLATILARKWPEEFEELKNILPQWTAIICIAGYERYPEERIKIQENYLIEICRNFNLKPEVTIKGIEGRENTMLELLSNAWFEEPYWKLKHKGSCRDIFFLTPISKIPEYIKLMNILVKEYGHLIKDVGCYIQPMVQGRGCHCEFNIFCDGSDVRALSAIKKFFTFASESLLKSGAFFSRPYDVWANMVYNLYPEGVKLLRTLKGIFDPNNILNPGKLCF